MAKLYQRTYSMMTFILVILVASSANAFTDRNDVIGLQDLYKTLNQPSQLMGWSLDDDWDPCNDNEYEWNGVVCLDSSVIYLFLDRLDLTGYISANISYLHSLRHLGMSYNNLTGDLPSSFRSLQNLTELYLQNNHFTGSVACLAKLPLTNLNIEDNKFSGVIPSQFQSIPNLRIGGNRFQASGIGQRDNQVVQLVYRVASLYDRTTIQYWTVYGLWITKGVTDGPGYLCYDEVFDCQGSLTFDIGMLDMKLLNTLHKMWPALKGDGFSRDLDFWRQEYQKHGSCMLDILPTESDYLRKAAELWLDIDLDYFLGSQGKYQPGTSFKKKDFLHDILVRREVELILECDQHRLVKVKFCYTRAWKPIDCLSIRPGLTDCPESIFF